MSIDTRVARDLPPELWGVVLSKLPEDDLSRRRASQVSRAARDGERGCDCRVELKLAGWDKQGQLQALAAWGATRTGAVAATLSDRSVGPSLEHDLLSLACLGSMPTLVSLVLSLNLPVNYGTLAACTALTALKVAIPELAGLEYEYDDEMEDPAYVLEDCDGDMVLEAMAESGKFATLVNFSRLLEPGLLPLTHLQSLDVDGLVAPRGDIRVLHIEFLGRSTLPWLARLTQLTRLKARVFSVDEGAWSLPCLRELHVCGGYRSEDVDLEDEDRIPFKIDDKAALTLDNLKHISSQLTKLVMESCTLQGKVLALKPSVKELHLLTCASGQKCLKAICPGLTTLFINDDSWFCEEAFRVKFQPTPQLTAVTLNIRHYSYGFSAGERDDITQECRRQGLVLPKITDGRMASRRNRYEY